MNPISCLFGLRFAYLQAAILSIFNLIKSHASRNLFAFFLLVDFLFGRFCRLSRKWGDLKCTENFLLYLKTPNLVSVNQYNNLDVLLKNLSPSVHHYTTGSNEPSHAPKFERPDNTFKGLKYHYADVTHTGVFNVYAMGNVTDPQHIT